MWVNRRVPKEYLGAFKRGHRLASKDFIDDEFSFKLLYDALAKNQKAIEALKFLTKFNNEYHKNVLKKGDPNALHHTDSQRKECYSRNNRLNRDALNVNKGVLSLDLIIWKNLRYHEMIEDHENDKTHLLELFEVEDGLENIA